MTRVEYDPLRLANEIEAALAKYGSGSDHRICKTIHFFEGELRLIAECLRCADPQNRDADRRVIDWSAVIRERVPEMQQHQQRGETLTPPAPSPGRGEGVCTGPDFEIEKRKIR
jgi:hypothetical protein